MVLDAMDDAINDKNLVNKKKVIFLKQKYFVILEL